jgi:hypothetical protein
MLTPVIVVPAQIGTRRRYGNGKPLGEINNTSITAILILGPSCGNEGAPHHPGACHEGESEECAIEHGNHGNHVDICPWDRTLGSSRIDLDGVRRSCVPASAPLLV